MIRNSQIHKLFQSTNRNVLLETKFNTVSNLLIPGYIHLIGFHIDYSFVLLSLKDMLTDIEHTIFCTNGQGIAR